MEGWKVKGDRDGLVEGNGDVGMRVGFLVGNVVEGKGVGIVLGKIVGCTLGALVGLLDGALFTTISIF